VSLPLRRPKRCHDGGEFYARWTLEGDVERAARAGGLGALGIWATIRAIANRRPVLEGNDAPRIADVARWASTSPRTVERHLAKLEAAGLLRVVRPPGRKPTWILGEQGFDPRQTDGGGPSEWEATPDEMAGVGRQDDAPAPPQRGKRKRDPRDRAAKGRSPAPADLANAVPKTLSPPASPYYLSHRKQLLERQRRELLSGSRSKR